MNTAPKLSFEFFPPKTDKGKQSLLNTHNTLSALKPEFFSVTFGAGGSTQERTLDTVSTLMQQSTIEVAPHLSCIGAERNNIENMLNGYKEKNIKRIVALRGDLPSGMVSIGDFNYASDLIRFIRETTGDHFHLEVAAYPEFHPQAQSAKMDLKHFRTKVEAGANSAITQYFFNADAYFSFLDRCSHSGIDIPIIPGIMPITNYTKLASFSDRCGAEIPRWIRRQLEAYNDDTDSIKAFGEDVITSLCERLIDAGVPGIHFYTLNQANPTLNICKNLKLGTS